MLVSRLTLLPWYDGETNIGKGIGNDALPETTDFFPYSVSFNTSEKIKACDGISVLIKQLQNWSWQV